MLRRKQKIVIARKSATTAVLVRGPVWRRTLASFTTFFGRRIEQCVEHGFRRSTRRSVWAAAQAGTATGARTTVEVAPAATARALHDCTRRLVAAGHRVGR